MGFPGGRTRSFLRLLHRAYSAVGHHCEEHTSQCQQCIEIQRHRRGQHRDRIAKLVFGNEAQHIGAPAIQEDDHANRRRGGIDQIGEPFTAHLQAVEERPAHNARRKQADIGLDKDQRAGQRRHRPGPPPRTRCARPDQPVDHALNAARPAHIFDQRANDQAEEKDARIAPAAQHLDAALDRVEQAKRRVEARDQRL